MATIRQRLLYGLAVLALLTTPIQAFAQSSPDDSEVVSDEPTAPPEESVSPAVEAPVPTWTAGSYVRLADGLSIELYGMEVRIDATLRDYRLGVLTPQRANSALRAFPRRTNLYQHDLDRKAAPAEMAEVDLYLRAAVSETAIAAQMVLDDFAGGATDISAEAHEHFSRGRDLIGLGQAALSDIGRTT